MSAYYNEIDPYCIDWLQALMAQNLIEQGDIDTRSIVEVTADDLKGYDQCHFFAGIGGWALAFRWAGLRKGWSGSCPCQPFSSAGKQKGKADERHLWPIWFRLIAERRPPVVFGEQVASAIAHEWLDECFHDLEGKEYACAAAVLPACSVGAPHRRDRLWFVADSSEQRRNWCRTAPESNGRPEPTHDGAGCGYVANANDVIASDRDAQRSWRQRLHAEGGCGAGCAGVGERQEDACVGNVADARIRRCSEPCQRQTQQPRRTQTEWASDWLQCPDGKARPVKPGIRLLAHGIPARVGKLRAYGNAIVPQVAAGFIGAYLETIN